MNVGRDQDSFGHSGWGVVDLYPVFGTRGPLPAVLHSTATRGLRTGCVWDSGFLDKMALHTRCFEASGQWRP